MLTREEINNLSDEDLNQELWKASNLGGIFNYYKWANYLRSLDSQFEFVKIKKLKWAVLFSPNPEVDWGGAPDQYYLFLYDTKDGGQEEVSNSLRTGAEILLWLSQEL